MENRKSKDIISSIISNVINNNKLDNKLLDELSNQLLWDIYDDEKSVFNLYLEMIQVLSSKYIPVVGNYRLNPCNTIIYDFITSHYHWGDKLNTSLLTMLNNELTLILDLVENIKSSLSNTIHIYRDNQIILDYITQMIIPDVFKLDPVKNTYKYVIMTDTDYIYTTKSLIKDLNMINDACLKLYQLTGDENFKQASCSILNILLYNTLPKMDSNAL